MSAATDGEPGKTLTVPKAASSVAAARRFIHHHCLATSIEEELLDTVVLLTSEIVTNAVLHAGSPAHITMTTTRDRLRVEVRDASTVIPQVTDRDSDALYGRGLTIVDTLAADWGARVDEAGKAVWFEVALEPAVGA